LPPCFVRLSLDLAVIMLKVKQLWTNVLPHFRDRQDLDKKNPVIFWRSLFVCLRMCPLASNENCVHLEFLGRIACTQYKMRPTATDVTRVCMSVCVSVTRMCCAKTAEPVMMPFGG